MNKEQRLIIIFSRVSYRRNISLNKISINFIIVYLIVVKRY